MSKIRSSIVATLAGLAFAFAAAAQTLEVTPATVPAEALKPGIRATYWYAVFRHVDEFEDVIRKKQGWTPAPIAALDSCDGNGKLYEAGVIENYGIRGEGFLNFPAAGEYQLAIHSNDGIRFKLAGKVVIEDPDVHSERMSLPAAIKVAKPGPVPFDFVYFQKKGGACLELFWQGPGESKFSVVPASVYLHQPK